MHGKHSANICFFSQSPSSHPRDFSSYHCIQYSAILPRPVLVSYPFVCYYKRQNNGLNNIGISLSNNSPSKSSPGLIQWPRVISIQALSILLLLPLSAQGFHLVVLDGCSNSHHHVSAHPARDKERRVKGEDTFLSLF